LFFHEGENICIARTPREFAEKTVDLLRHPERAAALGRGGQQTVREQYSWDIHAARLESILWDAVTMNTLGDKGEPPQG
jgi:glycosyltransferase involved in cell wall biosynthesis